MYYIGDFDIIVIKIFWKNSRLGSCVVGVDDVGENVVGFDVGDEEVGANDGCIVGNGVIGANDDGDIVADGNATYNCVIKELEVHSTIKACKTINTAMTKKLICTTYFIYYNNTIDMYLAM
jgi:hypothetical protein